MASVVTCLVIRDKIESISDVNDFGGSGFECSAE